MNTSSLVRGLLIVVVVVAGLAALRFRPWERSEATVAGTTAAKERSRLTVGFLPVT